ncbi:MAG: galactokinase [Spirochaetaceae bacterium]|nr:galactokinase [Spirochaetaceae bacterium]
MSTNDLINDITKGRYDGIFSTLYAREPAAFHRKRWAGIILSHQNRTGDSAPRLFSSPGRTELSGNHTDHNRGRVLAAAVQLDTIAAVSEYPADSENSMIAEVISEGYPPVQVDLSNLEKVKDEEGTTDALLRGIAASIVRRGGIVGGFSASTSSRVLKGSGLSSSAALEVLVGSIFNEIFNNGRFTSVELAIIGRDAENNYFGKPCGLMDQTACAVGGVVTIDFAKTETPIVEPLTADFASAGYTLAVVDSGGDHADLTPDYAAIPDEMKAAAMESGAEVLRDADEKDFMTAIPKIREKYGDRAVLRALHFYGENQRVEEMVNALKTKDIKAYLEGVRRSGDSSWRFLQNVFSPRHVEKQGVSLALALSERFLGGEGASRVHGGGFAGTIQVFIPKKRFDAYTSYMEGYFGEGSVVPLSIRPIPVGELIID